MEFIGNGFSSGRDLHLFLKLCLIPAYICTIEIRLNKTVLSRFKVK